MQGYVVHSSQPFQWSLKPMAVSDDSRLRRYTNWAEFGKRCRSSEDQVESSMTVGMGDRGVLSFDSAVLRLIGIGISSKDHVIHAGFLNYIRMP